MKTKSLFLTILHAIHGQPIDRANDALNAAVKSYARRAAEAAYHEKMANHFTDIVIDVDPHHSVAAAWEYANARQKQHDHQQDWFVEDNRTKEAHARVLACKARIAKLKTTMSFREEGTVQLKAVDKTNRWYGP